MGKSYGPASFTKIYDNANPPTITFKEFGGSNQTSRKLRAVKVDVKNEGTVKPIYRNGKRAGSSYIRGRRTLTLELAVHADTNANALTAVRLPVDMQAIALTDFVGDDDTFLNGTWCYETGATGGFSEEEEYKMNIELYQEFDENGTLIDSATLMTPAS